MAPLVGILTFFAVALAASPDFVMVDEPFGPYGRHIQAAITIQATQTVVFATLTDYAHFHEFMPLVQGVTVLERRPNGAVLDFRMKYIGFIDGHQVDERVFDPPKRILYHGVRGMARSVVGSWQLDPLAGGRTRLRYEASVDPGFPVPGPVASWLIASGVPKLMDGIRLRTEKPGWRRPDAP